jgi:hypothetical protein
MVSYMQDSGVPAVLRLKKSGKPLDKPSSTPTPTCPDTKFTTAADMPVT